MATRQDRAQLEPTLLKISGNSEGDRTWKIFDHILDDGNRDEYVSRDFFSVLDRDFAVIAHCTISL